MNKIVLLGKLIRDPELKTLENGEKVFTRFIIAVDRNFKSQDGTRKSDLIPVTFWGRKAEVVCKYMKKGSYITLSGRLRTGSYEDKDGNKKYIAEVVAEDFKFVGNRKWEREDTSEEEVL
ncbi:single-stranded DNA-binding protein [Clostridium chauvoei]|uniref:Single-stranded DNA-binding protein n=2 Tax=Clostridium chauvoei TaxID=46867 RepID=S6F6N7_9CLOT|nr:single-stranded DNA-binding protein [Clostridium chauvoei]ATD54055.1 single-stranded DNA-binding protein [Clostridium chauvoei]MBX7281314.1 single-stranded DNA-binding protein [Clostridium chauvoei]MBX7283780.1 single-stranded DNA-binding protein [Clostridium chauvoei]MBX7286403.1 single-stranded DNA-binding protein [Clostridium chauvoei]MBX7288844.1 single-stranded DNA-binding protein [Clostridium chauvoei]